MLLASFMMTCTAQDNVISMHGPHGKTYSICTHLGWLMHASPPLHGPSIIGADDGVLYSCGEVRSLFVTLGRSTTCGCLAAGIAAGGVAWRRWGVLKRPHSSSGCGCALVGHRTGHTTGVFVHGRGVVRHCSLALPAGQLHAVPVRVALQAKKARTVAAERGRRQQANKRHCRL